VILYLDASALVKRYIDEPGSAGVASLIAGADITGTAIISRAETAAALAKAARVGVLKHEAAGAALATFRADWTRLVRIQATEPLVARADTLAWEMGLRGYDAVHLASALLWRENMDQDVVVATFDRQLWQAAGASGLICFPEQLPAKTSQ
jgi:uncharacterized protein